MYDKISISNNIGHPDVFLTKTCNPNWPEIQDALFPGKKTNGRPVISIKVFNMKKKILLHDMNGQVVGHTSVIEFQKQRLFHAHVILFLDANSKDIFQSTRNL